MLREIVKIANKLDSLGLNKEADILDSFIRKIAENTLLGSANYETESTSGGSNTNINLVAEDIANNINDQNPSISNVDFVAEFIRRFKGSSAKPSYDPNNKWDGAARSMANKQWDLLQSKVSPNDRSNSSTGRGPVKDWAYYIKNTETQDGVGGQQVYDAWKRFTSSPYGSGHTPDYKSFVSWWKNSPDKLYDPKDVVDALIGVIDRVPQGRVSGGRSDAEAEAARRNRAVETARGNTPPPSNFATRYDD